jgi:iron(III) transport system ATP-binding protein
MIPAVLCRNLGKRYGEVRAVDGLDLALPRGRLTALLGPSGCGKTTLLRLLAGFEHPDQGTITLDERLVAGPRVWVPPEKRRVGMVFQDYALFPHLSVAQNVAYGLPRGAARAGRVAELLELVGLEGLGERLPHQLSGGQQQRAALARALAPGPAVLLLDEPFSNLDAALRRGVRAEVRRILRVAGITTLFVTHDQEEALSLSDQVAVMLHGRVAQIDAPALVYDRPATREVATFVGAANLLPAQAQGETALSSLGLLTLCAAAHGPVELLLRPEAIELLPDPSSPHTVVERTFFGHDQLVEVWLADGLTVQARTLPWVDAEPGRHVRLMVREPLVAFPVQ